MPAWGNYDNAANTPLWSTAAVKVAPTAANTANLFQNTTKDYWKVTLPNGGNRLADIAEGVFGVDNYEADVNNQVAHTGWVLRKVGYGNRAGRVQQEVLVAMNTMQTDGNSPIYPDAVVTISAQPTSLIGPIYQATAQTATFSVTASITEGNTSAPLTYQWQVNNNSGGTWVNIDAGTGVTTGQPGNMTKTGANTATLVLDPTGTTANNYVFRCVITATGTEATATSSNGRILIL